MLEAYRAHVADRAAQGVPPLPLSVEQTADLCELLKNPPAGEEEFWWSCSCVEKLIVFMVPPAIVSIQIS
jgi:aconitate hydratase 2 / 2-methylisocitrate dehydratase